jgi:hypothetical protein
MARLARYVILLASRETQLISNIERPLLAQTGVFTQSGPGSDR